MQRDPSSVQGRQKVPHPTLSAAPTAAVSALKTSPIMEKALLSDCWYSMNDTSPPADICKTGTRHRQQQNAFVIVCGERLLVQHERHQPTSRHLQDNVTASKTQ
jgi:hypothetical protein